MKGRTLMWILWPSFLIAGAASAVVFALVDPLDVAIFGYIRLERDALYAAGKKLPATGDRSSAQIIEQITAAPEPLVATCEPPVTP